MKATQSRYRVPHRACHRGGDDRSAAAEVETIHEGDLSPASDILAAIVAKRQLTVLDTQPLPRGDGLVAEVQPPAGFRGRRRLLDALTKDARDLPSVYLLALDPPVQLGVVGPVPVAARAEGDSTGCLPRLLIAVVPGADLSSPADRLGLQGDMVEAMAGFRGGRAAR